MDSHTIYLLVRTVEVLTRRQLALETLLQESGVSKEQIAAAASRAPIPKIIPTTTPTAYNNELEAILKAMER
jgi:hypothetical protein